MNEEFRSSQAFEALRQKAEKIARKRKSKLLDADELDLVRFSHELEVQRIELELQNEELRQANRELEQSRNEFADLYHSAPVAFLNLNSKGLIEKANEAAFRILPCDPNFLEGSSFARFIAAEDQRPFYSYLQELAGGKGAEPRELRILDQNEKRTLYLQLSATAKFDDKGMLDHWRLALVDITDRKLAEKKRREARDQLQKLNQSLEKKVVERTDDLEQTIRALENEIEERGQAQAELRQMTGKTIKAMEHDRRALSKEIHDSIGGSLAAIKMLLETRLQSRRANAFHICCAREPSMTLG